MADSKKSYQVLKPFRWGGALLKVGETFSEGVMGAAEIRSRLHHGFIKENDLASSEEQKVTKQKSSKTE